MISFESYMIFMRVRNKKTAIKNKITEIEQILVVDPVK